MIRLMNLSVALLSTPFIFILLSLFSTSSYAYTVVINWPDCTPSPGCVCQSYANQIWLHCVIDGVTTDTSLGECMKDVHCTDINSPSFSIACNLVYGAQATEFCNCADGSPVPPIPGGHCPERCPDNVTPLPEDECQCPGADCGCVSPLQEPDCTCPNDMGGGTPSQAQSGSYTQCTCPVNSAGGGISYDVTSPEYSTFSGSGGSCFNPDNKKCPDGSEADTSSGYPNCSGKCNTMTCSGAKYSASPNPATCQCGYCENGEPIIWSSESSGVCAGADEPTICDPK